MNDADQAHILRQRWRAQFQRLCGNENGAAEKEQEADLLVRYHDARDKALALKAAVDADTYYESAEKIVYDALRQQVRDFRVRDRTGRDMSPNGSASVINDFSEPSDEELLSGSVTL